MIGVHTPEFAFEHDPDNVRDAVIKESIHYPVGLDNSSATWQNYRNNYWPAAYLIDATGTLRYVKYGEGDYQQSEKLIRQLLVAANPAVCRSPHPPQHRHPHRTSQSSRSTKGPDGSSAAVNPTVLVRRGSGGVDGQLVQIRSQHDGLGSGSRVGDRSGNICGRFVEVVPVGHIEGAAMWPVDQQAETEKALSLVGRDRVVARVGDHVIGPVHGKRDFIDANPHVPDLRRRQRLRRKWFGLAKMRRGISQAEVVLAARRAAADVRRQAWL